MCCTEFLNIHCLNHIFWQMQSNNPLCSSSLLHCQHVILMAENSFTLDISGRFNSLFVESKQSDKFSSQKYPFLKLQKQLWTGTDIFFQQKSGSGKMPGQANIWNTKEINCALVKIIRYHVRKCTISLNGWMVPLLIPSPEHCWSELWYQLFSMLFRNDSQFEQSTFSTHIVTLISNQQFIFHNTICNFLKHKQHKIQPTGISIMVHYIKPAHATPSSHIRVPGRDQQLFSSSSLPHVPGKATDKGPSTQASASYMGDQDAVAGSKFQTGPVLAIVGRNCKI